MKTIKAKVHRLPTELMSGTDGLCDDKGMLSWRKPIYATYNSVFHHLYFTTDEEIKEGDRMLTHEGVETAEYDGYSFDNGDEFCLKIIATTDTKLSRKRRKSNPIKSVAEIPQSFIEEYCKAGGIDEVLVELESIQEIHVDGVIKQGVKLNPDNTIIIHPVKEKMYSRDEAIELIENYRIYAWKKGLTVNDFDKWIKENL